MKGKTYVYGRVPYYDPRIQNISYHYTYVGKRDNGETRKIMGILLKRSLIHGPFVPIMKIVGDTSIY